MALYAADNPAIVALVGKPQKECADDLEGELGQRYPDALLTYPGEHQEVRP